MARKRSLERDAVRLKVSRITPKPRKDPFFRSLAHTPLFAAALGALIGAILPTVAVFWQVRAQAVEGREQQAQQFRETRELQARESRRTAYASFLETVGDWATAQQERANSCKEGTNRPLVAGGVCGLTLGELEAVRRSVQAATIELQLVQTTDGQTLTRVFLTRLPVTVRVSPDRVVEGQPRDGYAEIYNVLLRQIRCESYPVVEESNCAEVRNQIHALYNRYGYREYVDG